MKKGTVEVFSLRLRRLERMASEMNGYDGHDNNWVDVITVLDNLSCIFEIWERANTLLSRVPKWTRKDKKNATTV